MTKQPSSTYQSLMGRIPLTPYSELDEETQLKMVRLLRNTRTVLSQPDKPSPVTRRDTNGKQTKPRKKKQTDPVTQAAALLAKLSPEKLANLKKKGLI